MGTNRTNRKQGKPMTKETFVVVCLWLLTVMAGVALWRFWSPIPNRELGDIRNEIRHVRERLYDMEASALCMQSIDRERYKDNMLLAVLANSYAEKARMMDAYDPDGAKKARHEMDGALRRYKQQCDKFKAE